MARPIPIWGKYLVTGKVERIDEARDASEAAYLVREYQMAFGFAWEIWSGKRSRKW